GIARATLQLPAAASSRLRARRLSTVSDAEALRRPLGGHFRDAFGFRNAPPREYGPLRVLFVSPYPICPPIHGGGVFMYQTVHELARLCELHAIIVLDLPAQRESHAELDRLCASTEYLVRPGGKPKAIGSIEPHAVREFHSSDLAWLIHRQIYTRQIDILQL